MNNKKIYIAIAAVICAVFLIVGAVFIIRNSDAKENVVSRYEWLEMLGEQFGITEYDNQSPYFKDVESDNPYFAYVQSAVEWDIIDEEKKFHGEDAATEEFVALTTMRAIGRYRVQIYMGTDKEPDKSDYLETAYANNLLGEDEHKQGFDREECLAVLDAAQRMDTFDLWKDDVVETTYQDNVFELEARDVLAYDEEISEIRVDTSTAEELSVGDIIIFETKGLKTARKIESMDSSGTISTGIPEMEEIFESLVISDMVSYSGEELAELYEIGNKESYVGTPLVTAQDAEYGMISSRAGAGSGTQNKEITFEIDADGKEETEIKVKIGDSSIILKGERDLSENEEMHLSYTIKNINANAQLIWDGLSVEYANVMLEVENDVKIAALKLEKEHKIPITSFPIPIGDGMLSFDTKLYLVFSVEGEVSLECEIPVGANVCYERGKGLRNSGISYSYNPPQINLSVEGSALIRLEPVLKVLMISNIMDVEIDAGVSATAENVIHDTQDCTDISVAFPVVKISVLGDDDLETIVGKGIKNLTGWEASYEREIISKEKAPYKLGSHYEIYDDGTSGFVEECTYGKKNTAIVENTEKEDSFSETASEFAAYQDYTLPIALLVNGPFEDAGDYYTIKGKLQIDYTIDVQEFKGIGNEADFTIRDKHFVKGAAFQTEDFPSTLYPVYCVEDDCTYYIVEKFSLEFGSLFRAPYYTLCRSIPDYDGIYESMATVHDELLEGEFRIAKDAGITSLMEMALHHMTILAFDASGLSEEEIREREKEAWKSALKSEFYTAEECYTDHILLDDYYNIAEYTTAYGGMDGRFQLFYITFDENGMIDSMIMNSF